MALKWTDTLEIAIALSERHPDVDPLAIHKARTHLRKTIGAQLYGKTVVTRIGYHWLKAKLAEKSDT